jgi:hypothetical protein
MKEVMSTESVFENSTHALTQPLCALRFYFAPLRETAVLAKAQRKKN